MFPPFTVDLGLTGYNPPRKWDEPCFDTFRTVAFDEDFMRRTIGFGTPLFDDHDELVGWRYDDQPSVGRVIPPMLRMDIWEGFVPDVYRAAVRHGALEVFEQGFRGRRFDHGGRVIAEYIYVLRRWIGENVDPV